MILYVEFVIPQTNMGIFNSIYTSSASIIFTFCFLVSLVDGDGGGGVVMMTSILLFYLFDDCYFRLFSR